MLELTINHLFQGGYLSTCVKTGISFSFAAYCRKREKSVDPRFRDDEYYGFFLLQIKELVQLKSSRQTYARQLFRQPFLTKSNIGEKRLQEFEKVNKHFSVYKNIRGTTSYYESVKKNAMATLRQKGSPHLFFTLSFAEYKDDELFKQILETNLNRLLTDKEIEEMKITATERNKIICKNVVQSTFFFERKLQKILNLLGKEGFGTPTSKKKYFAEDFMYKIKFQMRVCIYLALNKLSSAQISLKSRSSLYSSTKIKNLSLV